jgi:hypothetical protein
MMKKPNRRLLVVVLLSIATLTYMFAANPGDLPLPLLVVPFLLFLVIFYLVARWLLASFFSNLDRRTQKVAGLLLASLPVLLMVLQSIGQLSVRDLLIVFVLMAGLAFYLRRADFL